MNVNVENLGPCKKLLRFEVDPQQVDETFESVTKEFLKHAAMPGFRPGKAPKDMVLKKYEKDIEEAQAAQGNKGTAWSYEDAPSNYFGWLFWRHYYSADGDLNEQLERFMKDYSGASPQSAPNWSKMSDTEKPFKQEFPPNKSFDPKYTK